MDLNQMRDTDPSHLHPTFRERLDAVLRDLEVEKLPFRLFEGYRSPARQAMLYGIGREHNAPRVTNAKPWQSFHQYGIAADLVLFIDGKWNWDARGEKAKVWARMYQLAREHGLEPLSFEKVHVQLRGQLLELLLMGHYPAGGDALWEANLVQEIQAWKGSPASPPVPVAQTAQTRTVGA